MHNLDTTKNETSFVSARTDAWHHLGTTLPANFTAEEAMKYGRLGNWNIRKTPLQTVVPETGEVVDVADRFAVLRDNPVDGKPNVLGMVGTRYEVMQNEDLTGLLDTLVDESGANYETAGAIKGGSWVFVTMKMPGHIKVGGVDPVDQYLAAMTSHDGSLPTTVMVTPVRIVCQNTLNLAFKGAKNTLKVRHTRAAQQVLVAQARQALDFSFGYLEGFQAEADKLINTTMTQSQFEQIIAAEYGASEDAPQGVQTRAEERLDDLVELFAHAETQANIRDTAWAGLNALTEYADHHLDVRPGEDGDAVEARSRKAIFDPSFKNRARQLILSSI